MRTAQGPVFFLAASLLASAGRAGPSAEPGELPTGLDPAPVEAPLADAPPVPVVLARQRVCIDDQIRSYRDVHPEVYYPQDGCSIRAAELDAQISQACQVELPQLWAYGMLRLAEDVVSPMHTAPCFADKQGNRWVADPLFSAAAIPEKEWLRCVGWRESMQQPIRLTPCRGPAYPGPRRESRGFDAATQAKYVRSARCLYPCLGRLSLAALRCRGDQSCVQAARAQCQGCDRGCRADPEFSEEVQAACSDIPDSGIQIPSVTQCGRTQ